MGFLDALLGRTKPVPPKLDDLFAIPTAAITLQAAMGLVPTGTGSVCFRAAEGRALRKRHGGTLVALKRNWLAQFATAQRRKPLRTGEPGFFRACAKRLSGDCST